MDPMFLPREGGCGAGRDVFLVLVRAHDFESMVSWPWPAKVFLSLSGPWLSWAISTGCSSIGMCLGSSNQHIKALEVAIGDLFVWIRSI